MKRRSKLFCLIMAFLLIAGVASAALDGTIYRQNFGTNATDLPIIKEGDDPVTIAVWRDFNSTVMAGLDESAVFKAMEERTGVKIEWVYPPAGSRDENFMLRISTNDLPHLFSTPPDYPGGLEKAVDDDIYLPLNDYYDRGLTPNYQFLRETYPEIGMNTVLDSGLMVAWHMIDYVPSSPWTGLWVRLDWLEELGLDLPVTIEDWDTMLRKANEAYGAVLGLNIPDWYGFGVNFAFGASYDTGYNWINKDGVVEYGPANEGYRQFLTLLNGWYEDGLYDPDFATRTFEDYYANVANGLYSAFGMAYGELGPAIVSGTAVNPNFNVYAVRQPISYEGQVVKLRQSDSIVRTDKEYLTTRCVEDGIDDIAMMWKDWWYSQEGGDLCSYGPEGVSYVWNEDDTLTWIYKDSGVIPEASKDLDFWTVFPLFKLHNWGYLRDSTAYEMQPGVWQCIGEWSENEPLYYYPDFVTLTADEDKELSRIETNLRTYRQEMTFKFITGQESLEKFDDYVDSLKSMGLDDAIEIKQTGLDRYLAR